MVDEQVKTGVKAEDKTAPTTEHKIDAATKEKADVKSEVKTDGDAEVDMKSENTVAAMASRLRFFFSNANLRQDKFLRQELANNPDGYVLIKTFLKFNTVKKVSTDPEVLVRAVQEDEKLKTILKLNEDKTSIARINPYNLDEKDGNIPFTLRVSGIPVKGSKDEEWNTEYLVQREELEDAFREFGYVSMVKMLYNYPRRGDTGKGKTAIGRAWVEMETLEGMKAAADAFCPAEGKVDKDDEEKEETDTKNEKEEKNPKRTLKLGESEVRVKTMQQWLVQRQEKQAIRFGDKSRNGKSRGHNGKKETNGYGKGNEKGGTKRALDSVIKETAPVVEFKLDWKRGCVISLKGLPEGCDREKILAVAKNIVGHEVNVRADYSRGQEDGAIRFEQPNEKIATLAAKLADGSVTISDKKVGSASILEGEDEDKYYKEYIAFRSKQMQERKRARRS